MRSVQVGCIGCFFFPGFLESEYAFHDPFVMASMKVVGSLKDAADGSLSREPVDMFLSCEHGFIDDINLPSVVMLCFVVVSDDPGFFCYFWFHLMLCLIVFSFHQPQVFW